MKLVHLISDKDILIVSTVIASDQLDFSVCEFYILIYLNDSDLKEYISMILVN